MDDAEKLIEFNNAILSAKNLTQQKRFYMSTYGFKNSREVILGEQDTLVKADNYDGFLLIKLFHGGETKSFLVDMRIL